MKTLTEEQKMKISESLKGRKLSDEHKRKIAETMKGKIFSDEHKRKLSEANKGKKREKHPMFGKKHSDETKRKMSIARQNISEETRKKLSEANKGENNPRFGVIVSDETRKKISEALKGKKYKRHKKVKQIPKRMEMTIKHSLLTMNVKLRKLEMSEQFEAALLTFREINDYIYTYNNVYDLTTIEGFNNQIKKTIDSIT